MPRSTPPPPVWREPFRVRAYEVDVDERLRLPVLCDFLQEAAGRHAVALGFDQPHLESGPGAWVLQHLGLEVLKPLPLRGAAVRVTTWPSEATPLYAYRDYLVCVDDETVARGTSRWFVMDPVRRRPGRLPEAVSRHALPDRERALEHEPLRLKPPDRALHTHRVTVGATDLDRNRHANNARYVAWGLDATPPDWAAAHRLARLDIVYRAESQAGDSLTATAGPGPGGDRLRHAIHGPEGSPLALLETRWEPLG